MAELVAELHALRGTIDIIVVIMLCYGALYFLTGRRDK